MIADRYNIAALNKGLTLKGITAEFVAAQDETVDDEIMLYVENHAEPVAGVQFCGRKFAANCWTSKEFDEMEHAPEERTLNAAIGHAVYLLRKYGWITE